MLADLSVSSLLARALIDLLFKRDCSKIVLELRLFLDADLLIELFLVFDSLTSLLKSLLDARLHPVGIVAGGLHVEVIKLLLYVLPDFSILQEWVQLDDLHDLFLTCIKLVQVETDAVEGTEDSRS